MSRQSSWFEVDKEGLKQLQAGKPKHYLIRELIQNAWDENVRVVKLNLSLNKGLVGIDLEDDNKEGFKDLSDSYILFKETSKRLDPSKRGRFNLGEKQAFSICEKAKVLTTKGCIIFDSKGRTQTSEKTKKGSIVSVWVKMNESEFNEMLEVIDLYIIPPNIDFYVNGIKKKSFDKFKSFKANLQTEISDGKILRKTNRTTEINLYETNKSYLYEMGIPIMEIECEWSVDIQQKIPLTSDRETVSQSYLRDIFSEVLNNTYKDIDEESSSQTWIREGMCDNRIKKDAVDTILEKRYGDKVVVADPFDSNSIDEAISHGFRVIRGNELSKEEWSNIRRFDSLQSSSKLFGQNVRGAKLVIPNKEQRIIEEFAIKLADRLLGISISVEFIKERDMVTAQFGNQMLTFNISKLGKAFFKNKLDTISLILHEIAHHKGNHTDHSYHDALTKMAEDLVKIALEEPAFFN